MNPHYSPGAASREKLIPLYTADRPEVVGVVAAMRVVLDEFRTVSSLANCTCRSIDLLPITARQGAARICRLIFSCC